MYETFNNLESVVAQWLGASGARGPRFDPRSRLRKFWCLNMLSLVSFAGMTLDSRGIWKVLSMVLYLSNRFTNPIMCGIILKSYLSSILWHIFNEYIIIQTRKIFL